MKTAAVSKAQMIRDLHRKAPDATRQELMGMMRAKGFPVGGHEVQKALSLTQNGHHQQNGVMARTDPDPPPPTKTPPPPEEQPTTIIEAVRCYAEARRIVRRVGKETAKELFALVVDEQG